MANDRFSFTQQQAPGFDFSPIMEGAKATAAGYAAFGESVGQGIAKLADQKRKEAAEEKMQALMSNLSSQDWYKEDEVVPAREEFGELYSLFTDESGKVNEQLVSAHLTDILSERLGVDKFEAGAMAAKLMKPQKVRYLTEEGRTGMAKSVASLSGQLAKMGIDPSYMVGPIQHAMGEAAPTRDEALMGMRSRTQQILTPMGMTDQQKLAATSQAQTELEMLRQAHESALQQARITGTAEAQEQAMRLEHMLGQATRRLDQSFDLLLAGKQHGYRLEELTTQGAMREAEGERDFERTKILQGLRQEQNLHMLEKTTEAERETMRQEYGLKTDLMLKEAEAQYGAMGMNLTPADARSVQKLGSAVGGYLTGERDIQTTLSMSADDIPEFQNNEVLLERLRKAGFQIEDEAQLRNIRIGLTVGPDGRAKAVARVYAGGGAAESASSPGTKAAQKVLDEMVNATPTVAARLLLGSSEVDQKELEKMSLLGPAMLGEGWALALSKLVEGGVPPSESADTGSLFSKDRRRYELGGVK